MDTVRYDFLVSKLLESEYPVMLVGPVGTGKTSTAMSVIGQLNKEKYTTLLINMSAQVCSKKIVLLSKSCVINSLDKLKEYSRHN